MPVGHQAAAGACSACWCVELETARQQNFHELSLERHPMCRVPQPHVTSGTSWYLCQGLQPKPAVLAFFCSTTGSVGRGSRTGKGAVQPGGQDRESSSAARGAGL